MKARVICGASGYGSWVVLGNVAAPSKLLSLTLKTETPHAYSVEVHRENRTEPIEYSRSGTSAYNLNEPDVLAVFALGGRPVEAGTMLSARVASLDGDPIKVEVMIVMDDGEEGL